MKWLAVLADHYQVTLTELQIIGYAEGLRDLSAKEIGYGCSEALRTCKFIPRAADVLDGLRSWRVRQQLDAVASAQKGDAMEGRFCPKCSVNSGYKLVPRSDGNPGVYAVRCDHQ